MYIGKSIMGIFLALVMLASVSVALAMWSETLRINVTVNTGEVDVVWSSFWDNDTIEKPEVPLDVTKVYVEAEEYDDGGVIKLNVTIDNAYPCYNVSIYGNVSNIGTIPVKLLSATIKYTINAEEQSISLPLNQWVDLDLDNDSKADINVFLEISNDTDCDGTQIDPGSFDVYELTIHVKQDAKELTPYFFEIEMVFAQWNEV